MPVDVLDTQADEFLSTPRRREMLAGLPLTLVPVPHEGTVQSLKDLVALIGPSNYVSDEHFEGLRATCRKRGLDVERVLRETDPSRIMEGLYIKVEEDGHVTDRYKFVRHSFLTNVITSETHWLDRPVVPNGLAAGDGANGGT